MSKQDIGVPSEHEEQCRFVTWFEQTFPKSKIFAIPNGGKRDKISAIKLKAEGVRSGVPDLMCPDMMLFIEMKRKSRSRISVNQNEWIKYLMNCGYIVIVAYGFHDGKLKVLKLFNKMR
jgi:hypothetical protein